MLDSSAALRSDSVSIDALQRWVGRTQPADDVAAPGPLARLAALLDHETPPWTPGRLPPLAHWLYFLPRERQSDLEPDGHAKRGEFLPPVPLPRRMWGGSRVRFVTPVPVGAEMRRRSTVAAIAAKHGRSGPMVLVTVEHSITVGEALAITEEQDIVFLSAGPLGAAVDGSPCRRMARPSDATRSHTVDPVGLFRFSALTFNAHRIHYDRDYARQTEGYAGLVVHGPLIATLLMDHFLRRRRDAAVSSFSFRAERPLFDSAPFDLCLAENDSGAQLWAADATGAIAMSARVECR
jgi:3-methylfumaryl-CoA hydratase